MIQTSPTLHIKKITDTVKREIAKILCKLMMPNRFKGNQPIKLSEAAIGLHIPEFVAQLIEDETIEGKKERLSTYIEEHLFDRESLAKIGFGLEVTNIPELPEDSEQGKALKARKDFMIEIAQMAHKKLTEFLEKQRNSNRKFDIRFEYSKQGLRAIAFTNENVSSLEQLRPCKEPPPIEIIEVPFQKFLKDSAE